MPGDLRRRAFSDERQEVGGPGYLVEQVVHPEERPPGVVADAEPLAELVPELGPFASGCVAGHPRPHAVEGRGPHVLPVREGVAAADERVHGFEVGGCVVEARVVEAGDPGVRGVDLAAEQRGHRGAQPGGGHDLDLAPVRGVARVVAGVVEGA